MYTIRTTSRRLRAPMQQPAVRVVPTVAPTRWAQGLFAGTVLVALLALAAWLDDDTYLVSNTAAAEQAYLYGLVDGIQRGRDEMRDQLADVWRAGAAAGQAEVRCPAVVAAASGAAQ